MTVLLKLEKMKCHSFLTRVTRYILFIQILKQIISYAWYLNDLIDFLYQSITVLHPGQNWKNAVAGGKRQTWNSFYTWMYRPVSLDNSIPQLDFKQSPSLYKYIIMEYKPSFVQIYQKTLLMSQNAVDSYYRFKTIWKKYWHLLSF